MRVSVFNCLCFCPQWCGRRHGEGEPADETEHVSVRLQQLAERPVNDAQQRQIESGIRRTNMLLMFMCSCHHI